jgi:hypothetical protein
MATPDFLSDMAQQQMTEDETFALGGGTSGTLPNMIGFPPELLPSSSGGANNTLLTDPTQRQLPAFTPPRQRPPAPASITDPNNPNPPYMTPTGGTKPAGGVGQGGTGLASTDDPMAVLRQIVFGVGGVTDTWNKMSKEDQATVRRMAGVLEDSWKQQQQLGTRIEEAQKQLIDMQLAGAKKQMDMDDALTQWAQRTPTRQAAYALGMHMAAPLSVLAAIGGALTKTNAIGLLSATNGIMEGINSGSEEKYQDALNQWKIKYDAMNDHMERSNKIFETLKDAYAGRLDAEEKAAARARQATQDQLAPDQLKIDSNAALWKQKSDVWRQMGVLAAAMERMRDVGFNRLLGFGLGGDSYGQPISDATRLRDLPQNETGALQLIDALERGGIRGIQPSRYNANLQMFMAEMKSYPDETIAEAKQIWQGGPAQVAALRSAATAAGRVAGSIEGAANTLKQTIPKLRQLASYVNNKYGWRPLNALKVNTALLREDPLVRQFVNLNESARNDYFMVVARSGRALADRARNMEQLDARENYQVYLAELKVIEFEMLTAEAGYRGAMLPETYQRPVMTPGHIPMPFVGPSGDQPGLDAQAQREIEDFLGLKGSGAAGLGGGGTANDPAGIGAAGGANSEDPLGLL